MDVDAGVRDPSLVLFRWILKIGLVAQRCFTFTSEIRLTDGEIRIKSVETNMRFSQT